MTDNIEVLAGELRTLYGKYGYLPYKMSKFEEYALYMRNKDFLISDRILTFTDTNGKLMALKPDVTLSIVKNTAQNDGTVQRVCYNENVYRSGKSDQGFREIMQIGLECMGPIDSYCILEVLTLALKSLDKISPRHILDVSHLGLLSRLLDELSITGVSRQRVLDAISRKSLHEISDICSELCICDEKLLALAEIYGPADKIMPRLETLLPPCPELDELKTLLSSIETAGYADNVRIDFSVINDVNYYNGIVFRGFIEGIPTGILSGGRYDGLMKKMGRSAGAIGFAIYPELLEHLNAPRPANRADAMLIYSSSDAPDAVASAVSLLTEKGMSVNAQPKLPENIPSSGSNTGFKIFKLCGNEVKPFEADA